MLRQLLNVFIIALLAGTTATALTADTQRSAHVRINNQTGKDIAVLWVIHKYSDEYKDKLRFENIRAGGNAGVSGKSKNKTVRYYTGFTTTGKDWWQVLWTYADNSDGILNVSDPGKLRCVIDGLEQVGQVAIPIVSAGAMAGLCAACGPKGIMAAAAAYEAGNQFVSRAMNDESTCGFKQHILRAEDANQNTTIHLHANGSVVFASRSGTSSTDSRTKRISATNRAAFLSALPKSSNSQPGNASLSGLIAAAQNGGKCLHKQRDDFNNGNIIHLWDCGAGPSGNKSWVFDASTGYIRSAENSNKCLHKRDGGWNNGNVIHLWDCNAGPAENKTWYMDASTGYIRAQNNSAKCLHKQSGGFANGNRIHLWDCDAGPAENKTWRVAQ